MACEKCQGINAGELVRLGVIEIISVSREHLLFITDTDVIAEGFPKLNRQQFIVMFCDHMKCTPSTEVTRIEFRYL